MMQFCRNVNSQYVFNLAQYKGRFLRLSWRTKNAYSMDVYERRVNIQRQMFDDRFT